MCSQATTPTILPSTAAPARAPHTAFCNLPRTQRQKQPQHWKQHVILKVWRGMGGQQTWLVDRKNLSLSPGWSMAVKFFTSLSLALMTIFAIVFFGLFREFKIQIPNNFPRNNPVSFGSNPGTRKIQIFHFLSSIKKCHFFQQHVFFPAAWHCNSWPNCHQDLTLDKHAQDHHLQLQTCRIPKQLLDSLLPYQLCQLMLDTCFIKCRWHHNFKT